METTMRDVMIFFGMSSKEMMKEWVELSEENKEWFKIQVREFLESLQGD